MRILIAAALALGVTATNPAAAQEAAASSAPSPTPEAAARFIDSVIGNGVAKVSKLESREEGGSLEDLDTVRTAGCKTLILQTPIGGGWRRAVEIDWTSFVAVDSFYSPQVTDKWGVRVLARTTGKLVGTDDPSKVNEYSPKQHMGAMIAPGTAELKDRLIRAMEFYGKSCAPKLEGPF